MNWIYPLAYENSIKWLTTAIALIAAGLLLFLPFFQNETVKSSTPTKQTNSHQDIRKNKDSDERDTVKKKMRLIGPTSDETSYKIIFHVTSPPKQFVPILIGKDKSIYRKLVVDLYHMNFERWTLLHSHHENTNRGNSSKNIPEKEEYVLENRGVLPIQSIVNSSLVATTDERGGSYHSSDDMIPSATLELQLDISNEKYESQYQGGRKQMEQELLRNMVTEKNWMHHHHPNNEGQGLNGIGDETSIDHSYGGASEEISLAKTTKSITSHNTFTSNTTTHTKGVRIDIKEYNFQSEFEAGSFQTLYLALNTVGEEIRNMYSALELVHKQSLDFDESLYGDSNEINNRNITFTGVALDDVKRCIGDLPFIYKRLARIYDEMAEMAVKYQNSNQSEPSLIALAAEEDRDSSINRRLEPKQLHSRRALLGYVDFFHLFVPSLFHHTPYKNSSAVSSGDNHRFMEKDSIEAHQARARQLAKLQKRVAQASIRVYSYSKAMAVAHKGWALNFIDDGKPRRTLKKRLAFDLEDFNFSFDETSVNHYYDPPISPRCNYNTLNGTSESFDLRAYSVVGCHNIVLSPRKDYDMPGLSFSSDPVMHIPSLRTIVENNPELDFLILAFFLRGTCTITLFVRYGPDMEEGDHNPSSIGHISEQFESHSNFDLRIKLDDQSYHGHSTSLMNRLVNFIFNTDRKCAKHETISLDNAKDVVLQYPSPSSRLSTSTNYFGVNYLIDPIGFTPSHAFRLLRSLVPAVGTSPNIIDLSVLQRKGENEMICLASIRIVHLDPNNSQTIHLDDSVDYLVPPDLPDPSDSLNSDTCSLEDIELLKDILTDISVPTKEFGDVHTVNFSLQTTEALTDCQVLNFFSNDDIRRHFIAANKDLKETAIRLTETAAWRGLTFPIDIRKCAIELQSKQFFMQGVDRRGNPVFYFRNVCKGLWRKDIDASISAVIYKFEMAIRSLLKFNPNFKCTLVVLMGRPRRNETSSVSIQNENNSVPSHNNDGIFQESAPHNLGYHVHTNFDFVHKLIKILTKNYPDRLMMALLVPDGGWGKFLGGANIRRYIHSSRTRSRIIMLDNQEDLLKYISSNQLVDIAGGNMPIP